MTASGAPAFADSETDSFHMCSPVGDWKLNRDSSVDRLQRRGLLLLSRSSFSVWLLVSVLLSLLLLAQSQTTDEEFTVNRTALNQQIQQAAFQSFPRRVRTGTVYNATLPGNLATLVDVQMVRFRTGRLRRYGFQFQQVNLPVGVKVEQYMRHVVLVYRYFKDFNFHNLTSGTQFASPVVGVYVYSGANLTTLEPLPELTVSTTENPIEVTVSNLNSGEEGTNITCVRYNDTELTTVSNFTSSSSSICSWTSLGDFALLVPRTMDSSGGGGNNNAWKIALGAVAGAIVLLGLLIIIAVAGFKYRERAKFAKMERVADHGETLHHTLIGGGRAPAAASTRTKPTLESDYKS